MSAELTLQSAAGGSVSLTVDPTLTTDEVQQFPQNNKGMATAWCAFEDGAVADSYNCTISRRIEGFYDVTFTTPMDNANYCPQMSCRNESGEAIVLFIRSGTGSSTKTKTGFTVNTAISSGANKDVDALYITVFGGKN